MILSTNNPKQNRMRFKKALFIDSVDDESPVTSSYSCELGPDGIRFVRDNIKVTGGGVCKVTEDGITPLSEVRSDEIEYGGEIGRGASGSVQEAIYKPLNLPVAVKAINVYDRDKRRQVVNDLQIFLHDRLEQVKGNNIEQSSNLVQVYGAYYDEGSIKILLELMDAGSLRDIVNMAKRASNTAPYVQEPYLANIAYQILSGLDFIHTKKKQIHRDIKPENVLMNSLGQVKLSDFGISRQLEKTHAFSKTFVGTVTYMSPERLVGDPYSFSSDLWSLGLILIELATGEYPYPKTKKFIEVLQSIRNLPEPNLPDNGMYSEAFRDFVDKCLKKDPSKRCTAAQLMEHPWLIQNSELNLDISEWVCNLLFNCKYAESTENHDNFNYQQQNLAEMETVYDGRIFCEELEEHKVETPSFIQQTSHFFEPHAFLEQPKLQKFYSFGDVYDTNSHMNTNSTQACSPHLPEVKLSKISSFGMNIPSTKSGFSFAETRGSTPKTPLIMDLEIENLE